MLDYEILITYFAAKPHPKSVHFSGFYIYCVILSKIGFRLFSLKIRDQKCNMHVLGVKKILHYRE